MLGLVPNSIGGRYEDNLLQCSFIHYKEVNSSNSEYNEVPNLTAGHSYYLALGVGPAASTGKLAYLEVRNQTLKSNTTIK